MSPATITGPLLVTNNPACNAAYESVCSCIYNEGWTYGQVLEAVKEQIRGGFCLLSHPLAGSMKPNQTPFRSVLLAQRAADGPDREQSLAMVDMALEAYHKFQNQRATPAWPPSVREDFGTIDLSVMQGVMERSGLWASRRVSTT